MNSPIIYENEDLSESPHALIMFIQIVNPVTVKSWQESGLRQIKLSILCLAVIESFLYKYGDLIFSIHTCSKNSKYMYVYIK